MGEGGGRAVLGRTEAGKAVSVDGYEDGKKKIWKVGIEGHGGTRKAVR